MRHCTVQHSALPLSEYRGVFNSAVQTEQLHGTKLLSVFWLETGLWHGKRLAVMQSSAPSRPVIRQTWHVFVHAYLCAFAFRHTFICSLSTVCLLVDCCFWKYSLELIILTTFFFYCISVIYLVFYCIVQIIWYSTHYLSICLNKCEKRANLNCLFVWNVNIHLKKC